MSDAGKPVVRVPRSIDQATVLLERYSALSGELTLVEAERNRAIAGTNAVADTLAAPIIAELATIEAKVQPWWAANADAVTGGKRKSAELGGCVVGTVRGRDTLSLAGSGAEVADRMNALRWAKPFVRVKVSVDSSAVLKALDGKLGGKLSELGFAREVGVEAFFVRAVAQGGTVAANQGLG